MAVDLIQTNAAATHGFGVYCSGRSANSDTNQASDMRESGSAGSIETIVVLAAASTNVAAYVIMSPALGADVTWAAGTHTVRINIGPTTAANSTLTEIHVCRVNSSGTSVQDLGSVTGLSGAVGTDAVITQAITGVAAAPAAASTDSLAYVCIFTNTHHSQARSFGVIPDQTCNTPFTAVTIGELAGTSTSVITPTATLTGTGALAGTSTSVITPTATGILKASASGTVNVATTPTATLTAKGTLAGIANVATTLSATLVATGALLGSVQLAATPTATLTATGDLAGTTTLAIAPTATLTGMGTLAGTSSIAITLPAVIPESHGDYGVFPIKLNTEDGNEWAGIWWTLTHGVRIGLDSSLKRYGASSFSNCTIDPAKTIVKAELHYTVLNLVNIDAGDTYFIAAEDTGTAALPATANLPTSWTLTTAQTTGVDSNLPGIVTYTVDITDVIKEVIENGAWASGNRINLYYEDENHINNELVSFVSTTGALYVNQSVSPVSGTASLAITPTGSLTATGDLAGAVASAFILSATPTLPGAVAGTTSLVITPTATLTATGDLAGTIAVAITPTATLTATGDLAGTIAVAITPTATLTATGDLAGTIAVAITPTATLTATGDLAGTIAVAITPTATLTATGDLAGTVASAILPTGVLIDSTPAAGAAWMPYPRTTRYTQPSVPTALNKENQFGADCIFALLPAWTQFAATTSAVSSHVKSVGQEFDFAHQLLATPSSGSMDTESIIAGQLGAVRAVTVDQESSAVGSRLHIDPGDLGIRFRDNNFTILCLHKPTGDGRPGGSGDPRLFSKDIGNTAPDHDLMIGTADNAGRVARLRIRINGVTHTILGSGTFPQTDALNLIAGTLEQSTGSGVLPRVHLLREDGTYATTSLGGGPQTGSYTPRTTTHMGLFANSGIDDNAFDGSIIGVWAFDRTFTEVDFRAFLANPWQTFEDEYHAPILIGSAAAGGVLAGTVNISITPTATLTGDGDLAGTTTAVITPTATLTATGDLAGATTAVIIPTATLTSTGELAGTTTSTIIPTGTLIAKGTLAGTASSAITLTATLTGTGDLAGTATSVITLTGTLISDAISGTVSVVITPTATLTGTGDLAGTTTSVIIPSAALTGIGALAGTTTSVITPTATLTSTGDLAGTATSVITPTGTLTGTGALAGTVALQIIPTGTLISDAISGTVSVTITPTGTLTATGDLAGTVSSVFVPTGTLTATGDLAGTSSLAITPTGTLTADGALVGSASLVIAPTATLTATGDLAGTVSSAIILSGTLINGSQGAIAGTVSLATTPTGTLTATGDLAGTVSLVITPTATLTAIGDLAGTSSVVVTPTATLTATGDLAGTTSLVILPTGTLINASQGAVSGTANLTITPTATLTATGDLAGTSTSVITPTATLTGLGDLAGTTSLVITPSGVMLAKGFLTGNSALAFNLSGTLLDAASNLAGSISAGIVPVGTLTATGDLAGTSTLIFTPTGTLNPPPILAVGKYSIQLELATRLIREKGDTLEVHRYSDPGPGAYDPITDSPLPVVQLPSDRFTAHGVLLPLTQAQIADIILNDPLAVVSQKARLLLSTEDLKFYIAPGQRIVFDSSVTPSAEWWSIESLTRLSPDLIGRPILYTLQVTRHDPESTYLPAVNDVYTNSIELAQRLIEKRGEDAIFRHYDWQDGTYDPGVDNPDPVRLPDFVAPIVVLPLSREMDIAYANTTSVFSERAFALLAGADATFIPMPGHRVLTGDVNANDWWSIESVIVLEPNRDKILYKLVLTRGGGEYNADENLKLLLEDGEAILMEDIADALILLES